MRILKILSVFFLIYFIKRFMEMYRVMKNIQDQQLAQKRNDHAQPQRPQQNTKKVIDADFKVMD